ncbi:MAG: hypothetical protein EBY20_07805 [Alphaproteobacteria bacterium]|nr:hypothetical protein [Alphaproteobacteria bacterium]
MNAKQHQLLEKDVRRESPDLNSSAFLQAYLKSNFPQTAAHPSAKQNEYGVLADLQTRGVEYNKKPRSGTSFDNPASS